jgi:hypothetical protein
MRIEGNEVLGVLLVACAACADGRRDAVVATPTSPGTGVRTFPVHGVAYAISDLGRMVGRQDLQVFSLPVTKLGGDVVTRLPLLPGNTNGTALTVNRCRSATGGRRTREINGLRSGGRFRRAI